MPDSWGRWGTDDELGSLNLVTPREVVRGAGLVSQGRVLRLGHDLGPQTPVAPHRKRPERFMTRDGGDYAAGARAPHGFAFAEEVVSFAAHSGTHMDALAHAWYDDQLYNGFPASGTRSTTGATRCGAEKLRPVATRGVLLDIPALYGGSLGDRQPITAQDLERAASAAGVTVESGDAVLIRTGWTQASLADPPRFFASEPGIDVGAGQWLVDAGVAVVGSDNYAIEAQPAAEGTMFPVHQLLIRDHGVPLIEGMVLDELAAAATPAFFFVAAPLPLVGGTAGPVCPVAVL